MFKFITYFLQSIIIYLFFLVGRIIGLKNSRKFFSKIFLLLAPLFRSRKIMERNLHIFKKNITDVEKKRIIKNMWENYGMTFIEYIFLDYFKNNNSHVTIEGGKELKELLIKGKPVIFVSGHFANFELMSMEISKMNIKLATIYRPLNNYFLNPFMEYLRKKYICANQIKKGIKGVKESISFLKSGYSIALMIDQRVSEGEKIDFFNKSALTTTLPAQLAKKFNIPIVPVFINREEDDFKIKFFSAIKFSDKHNKFEISENLNKILEQMISNNPNQWIWTHNRWK